LSYVVDAQRSIFSPPLPFRSVLVSFGEGSSTEGNEGNEGEETDLKSADSFSTVTFISFARRGTGAMPSPFCGFLDPALRGLAGGEASVIGEA
jgi:hypothetical protein